MVDHANYRDAEPGFEDAMAAQFVRSLPALTALVGGISLVWSFGDFEFARESAPKFLALRTGSVAANIVLTMLALRTRSLELRNTCIWSWFVIWAIPIVLMIPEVPDFTLSLVFPLTFLQWGSCVLVVWRWKWGVSKSVAIMAMAELAILKTEFVGYNSFAAHGYLLTGVGLNVALTRIRFASKLKEFRAAAELEATSLKLTQALEQAKEVDRVKSEFFANISHELRTPLTLIIAPVEEMLDSMAKGAERDALKVVRRNARRLLRMIEDLLDLARLEAGGLRLRVSEMDLVDLAERVTGNIGPTAESKNVDLSFEATGDCADMFGDAHRVEIILTNLLGNAVKFTPEGGRISVRARLDARGGTIEVSDTGPGIPADALPKVFERFYQVQGSQRRKHGGAGIGLALAKELSELHGGDLSVESTLGQGTKFTLFVPSGKAHFSPEMMERRYAQRSEHPHRRAEDRQTMAAPAVIEQSVEEIHAHASQQPEERILLDRGRVPRVLVVEDEAELRAFIVGVLSTQFEIFQATDGQDALNKMEDVRPDLVVTDVMMPGVSGLDLCRAIKSNPITHAIPVILLTAMGEARSALEGYGAGADDFVAKPFHTKVLMARIRAHLKMRSLALRVADQARLASAGTLAAGLAHEIKNPINAISNAIKVINTGGSSKVPTEKLLQIVLDGVQRIDSVVSALDAHARPADGLDLSRCDVREGLEATLRLLAHRLEGIEVHRDIQLTDQVHASGRAFNQVLMNLLDNAVRSGAKNLWVGLKQPDGVVQVTIADDGPGVPADIVERIFDPFFTTRSEGDGTGLGLHLSRKLARDCGGELRYEPRPGGGAQFVLEVPAMERAA